MIFTIKKNSKLPILKMKIFKDGRNFQDVSTFMNLLEEQDTITFSMKNVDNNQYKIVNKQGVLLLKTPATENSVVEYYISYKFNEEETDTVGIYKGEFKVTFSNDDYIILPIQDELYIHIKDSFIQ